MYVIVASPTQVPVVQVNILPIPTTPEITGATELLGACGVPEEESANVPLVVNVCTV